MLNPTFILLAIFQIFWVNRLHNTTTSALLHNIHNPLSMHNYDCVGVHKPAE